MVMTVYHQQRFLSELEQPELVISQQRVFYQQLASRIVLREPRLLSLALFVPLVAWVLFGYRVLGQAVDGLFQQLKKLKVTTKIKLLTTYTIRPEPLRCYYLLQG